MRHPSNISADPLSPRKRRESQNEGSSLVRGQAHQPCRDLNLLRQIGRYTNSR